MDRKSTCLVTCTCSNLGFPSPVRRGAVRTCTHLHLVQTSSYVFQSVCGGLAIISSLGSKLLGKMFNVYACSSSYFEHTESSKAPPSILFECTEASQAGSSSHFEPTVVFECTFQQLYLTKMLLALTFLCMA